jgi:hypothetical protein
MEYQEAFDLLKEKLVIVPILVFPNWIQIFHMHMDASEITIGVVLTTW